ncbi:NADPH-dependent FMN reductase [Paenibacillus sp. sgz302251]|uniref:NADPH-dependent FMN reductase n=1 Tax=Paenibacillus sp. sgz302251 TaxID=3414493 RepID=UPI003C7D8EFA
MKLVGISGTVTGTKTSIIVQYVLDQVKKKYPDVNVEYVDLKTVDLQFCDGRDPHTYSGNTKEVIEQLLSADFFLIGTPIFRSSMTGALKNLFDLVPDEVFRNKVIGFVANGGTYQHYLVVENQVKPVAGYFRAFVTPSYVYVTNEHFNKENEIIDIGVLNRLDLLADELTLMHKGLKELQDREPLVK